MKRFIWFTLLFFNLFILSMLFSKPSFNDTTATPTGCTGENCHTFAGGIVSVRILPDRQIEITLSGVSQGENVAGELVDHNGNVAAVIQATSKNPFILAAPSDGDYTVNAGYKKPSKQWDSTRVSIGVTDINHSGKTSYPEKAALLGNHPNPFNHETVISFSLPSQQAVSLSVFDINGKLVCYLTDKPYAAGIQRIRWDGRDETGKVVASGVYIVRMKSEGGQFSHRVLLSK